jgi:hypothetical protein
LLSIFTDKNSFLSILLVGLSFGVVFGVISAALGYAATRGQRDFSSVQKVVATKYEVLVEHKHLAAGQELLSKMPGKKVDL